jgi:hypothetical protein
VGRSGTKEEGGLAHDQASQKHHDAQRTRHTNGVLRFPNGGLNFTKVIVGKEEEENNIEESEEDNDSDGTRPHKVNTAPGPKRALKMLRVQK